MAIAAAPMRGFFVQAIGGLMAESDVLRFLIKVAEMRLSGGSIYFDIHHGESSAVVCKGARLGLDLRLRLDIIT
ncbi:MAG: hypothetical protein ACRC22_02780 [Shewanella sp.]